MRGFADLELGTQFLTDREPQRYSSMIENAEKQLWISKLEEEEEEIHRINRWIMCRSLANFMLLRI